jgi:hypothetical protein
VTELDDSVRYTAYKTKREEALSFRGLPGDKSGNFTHKVRSQLAALPALQQSHTTHRLASNPVWNCSRVSFQSPLDEGRQTSKLRQT